jgi:hypothetical protein
MNEILIPLGGSFLGVFVGGLIGLLPVYYRNRAEDRRQARAQVMTAFSRFYSSIVRGVYELHYHAAEKDPARREAIWDRFVGYDTEVLRARIELVFLLSSRQELVSRINALFGEYRQSDGSRDVRTFLESCEELFTAVATQFYRS